MSSKNVTVRISKHLYQAAEAETRRVRGNVTPREVLEGCVAQGQEMLETLKLCRNALDPQADLYEQVCQVIHNVNQDNVPDPDHEPVRCHNCGGLIL